MFHKNKHSNRYTIEYFISAKIKMPEDLLFGIFLFLLFTSLSVVFFFALLWIFPKTYSLLYLSEFYPRIVCIS